MCHVQVDHFNARESVAESRPGPSQAESLKKPVTKRTPSSRLRGHRRNTYLTSLPLVQRSSPLTRNSVKVKRYNFTSSAPFSLCTIYVAPNAFNELICK